MRTSDAMTKQVVVSFPQMTIDTCRRLMREWNIRHLPVVQGGALVGILSDRDLLRRGESEACCGDVMTPAPVTCSPSASVAEAARLMIDHKIDALPIVEGTHTLLGLVTSSDLLRLLIDREEASAVLPFRYRLHLVEDGGVAAAVS